jgi:hypothetical protein
VTVTINGSRVTFTLASGRSFTGRLSGDSLSIRGGVVSGTLTASAPAAYTRALAALNTTIAAKNSATAVRLKDRSDLTMTSNDTAALQSQARTVAGDVSALADDVTRTDTDLATTKAAAAQGQGFNCQNIQNTVTDDAGVVLHNDLVTSAGDDAKTLRADLRAENADIANLNYGLQVLQLDNVAAPAGAAGILAAAQSGAATAVTQANADITQVNAAVLAGYQTANSLATGPCAEDGPGAAPAPVHLIG